MQQLGFAPRPPPQNPCDFSGFSRSGAESLDFDVLFVVFCVFVFYVSLFFPGRPHAGAPQTKNYIYITFSWKSIAFPDPGTRGVAARVLRRWHSPRRRRQRRPGPFSVALSGCFPYLLKSVHYLLTLSIPLRVLLPLPPLLLSAEDVAASCRHRLGVFLRGAPACGRPAEKNRKNGESGIR